MKIRPLIFLLIIKANLFAQINSPDQSSSNRQFYTKVKALQNGEISSLRLRFKDSIKIKPIVGEKIDDRDSYRHKNGLIWAGDLKPISAPSICEITENYVLLIVEDKFNQFRALTLSPDGTPIESILVYSDLLYLTNDWYEYEARRYSPARPYHYDPSINQFTFSTIFKIREPQYEEILIDFKDHEDETTNRRKIKVSKEGYFTEPTFERIHSHEIDCEYFTIKSSFIEEKYSYLDQRETTKNGDNLYKIYLDRSQSLELLSNLPYAHDQIFRIIPKTKGKIEVLQRITHKLAVNGDGDYCELKDLVFISNWEKLMMQNDLVSIKKYSVEARNIAPDISVKDLRQKIKKDCGDYHLSLTDYIDKKEAISSLVQTKEVILKVNFTSSVSDIKTTEYIIFVIANGC